jgi:hypothetical protein
MGSIKSQGISMKETISSFSVPVFFWTYNISILQHIQTKGQVNFPTVQKNKVQKEVKVLKAYSNRNAAKNEVIDWCKTSTDLKIFISPEEFSIIYRQIS